MLLQNMFKSHLFTTNVTLSVGLSALGDYLQQNYEKKSSNTQKQLLRPAISNKWDKKRTYQMSLSFGLTSGFLCHFWYNFLDRWYPGKGLKIVCKKIVIDQIIFSPICIVSCLLVACSLNRHTLERTYKEVAYKGPQLFIAECLLWPPAQFLNFYFLPTRYRVLYDNTISLVYDVYSSYVQHEPCCD